jgi:hypothetical protein
MTGTFKEKKTFNPPKKRENLMSLQHVFLSTNDGEVALPLSATRLKYERKEEGEEGFTFFYSARCGEFKWGGYREPRVRYEIPHPYGCELWIPEFCEADDIAPATVNFVRVQAGSEIFWQGFFTGDVFGPESIVNNACHDYYNDEKREKRGAILVDINNGRCKSVSRDGRFEGMDDGWQSDIYGLVEKVCHGYEIDWGNMDGFGRACQSASANAQ